MESRLMSFEFRDAVRQDSRFLILLAGGTGSGKTESAMRLATGLADGKPFAVIDTENGRALHKADDYAFKYATLDEPFSPERYAEAVKAADDAGFPVIVIDSGSHEYEGVGGVLDLQAEEFARMGSRESARMASWIEPKRRHKRFVQGLLRARAHIILCLRAQDAIEIVKQGDRTIVRAKESLIGVRGWVPIVEKRLPFEATISLMLLQENPGVPVPVKLESRHAALISLEDQLSEQTGHLLAGWAAGSSLSEPDGHGAQGDPATGFLGADVSGITVKQPSGSESEGNGAGLSKREFAAAVKAAGVSRFAVGEAGHRLFPGRSSTTLTDEERGVLWVSLSEPGADVATSLSSGAGASEQNPGLLGSGSESEAQTALTLPASVRRDMETGQ